MTHEEFKAKLTGLVDRRAKVGMEIDINGNTYKCIGLAEDERYGTRYVFENGTAWTKANIVQNIYRAKCLGLPWDFRF